MICHTLICLQNEGEDDETSESDWEPEADIVPTEREQTRSGRQRKRPSFFQVSYQYRYRQGWQKPRVFCREKKTVQ